MKPNVEHRVMDKLFSMVGNNGKQCDLSVGQCVLTRDYRGRYKWKESTVFKQLDPLNYLIKVAENMVWKHCIDQIQQSSHQKHLCWSWQKQLKQYNDHRLTISPQHWRCHFMVVKWLVEEVVANKWVPREFWYNWNQNTPTWKILSPKVMPPKRLHL